jgi:hypothetical protein
MVSLVNRFDDQAVERDWSRWAGSKPSITTHERQPGWATRRMQESASVFVGVSLAIWRRKGSHMRQGNTQTHPGCDQGPESAPLGRFPNGRFARTRKSQSGKEQGEENKRFFNRQLEFDTCRFQLRVSASRYSIAVVIFAVFSSMAETEQYFSLERRTASSTALRDTLPPRR